MHKTPVFFPKLLSSLQDYSFDKFFKDLTAGVIVGIVALPLAIAFGIASGVTPQQGLITAVVGGFIISALGGSRVQIGGPTGAFIVIVYGIVHKYGVAGLTIATMLAGVILIAMGFLRVGNWIKFIPTPVVMGFTTGIAVVIFSSQIKDLFGLDIPKVPSHFIHQWIVYSEHFQFINLWAAMIAISTIAIVAGSARFFPKIPGAFVALIVTTGIASYFQLPVETIGSRFGQISATLTWPQWPDMDFFKLYGLIVPAISIAMLGAIESLLSAVVADGMIGGKHRPNTELIAQGVANVVTPLFGGIPATGAIARTATNIRNGARSPVAGIVHAVTLLLILIFASRMAELIPMAALAGILAVVAYNMSEWREFNHLLKGPRADAMVLVATFGLTVLFDLNIAIQVGMVLSAFLFMSRMAQVSDISMVDSEQDADTYYSRRGALSKIKIPKNIGVFEISGAFFFGAATKFEEVLRESLQQKDTIVLRMNNVFVLDASGLRVLYELAKDVQAAKARLVFAEIPERVHKEFMHSDVCKLVGKDHVFDSLADALKVL